MRKQLVDRGPVVAALVLALAALAGCGAKDEAKKTAPAKTEVLAHESDLLKLTLTPQAVKRLDIATAPVAAGRVAQTRTFAGEVIAPALGGAGYAAFPSAVAGDPAAMAQAQIAADGEVARARTQLAAARVELGRAQRLLDQDAGSVQERDRAREQVDLARASLETAQARRALLGPSAQGGGKLATVWIRTPVYVGDLQEIVQEAPAQIGDLTGRPNGVRRPARPVRAPASATAGGSTVDLYYETANGDGALRLGQRVGVSVPLRTGTAGRVVPWSAILHDINGAEWVYEQTAPNVFVRRRVQVASVSGPTAALASGPAVGAKVVTRGAAELFGTEFGIGK